MNHLTKCSVFIELYLSKESTQRAGIGSAFLVKTIQNDFFLITNWHCVTGIDPETNKTMSNNGVINPEIMDVHFLKKDSLSEWIIKRIPLIDENGDKLYIEHPKGKEIDVVAIKLDRSDDIDYFCIWDGLCQQEFIKDITDSCSIVGFPTGISTGGKFPIWKTGHIASELELNHDDKPMFLIDASTRKGMSGSPVYCVKNNIVTFPGNVLTAGHDNIINFLGVYAGRVGEHIEIGRVFKASCVLEILVSYYKKFQSLKYKYVTSSSFNTTENRTSRS